ncbi:hypothetical protein D3C81_2018770 [compost metagenome]
MPSSVSLATRPVPLSDSIRIASLAIILTMPVVKFLGAGGAILSRACRSSFLISRSPILNRALKARVDWEPLFK